MESDFVALSDLCDSVGVQVDPEDHSGAIYIGMEHVSSGRLVRTGGGVAGDVLSAKYVFEPGDVLYGKLRPYLDKAVVADLHGICTTELLVLRPKENVDAKFLVAVLHSARFIEHAVAGTTGVQHPRTSWQHIATFPVPRYDSADQKRIATVLWRIHDAIEANGALVQSGLDLKRVAMLSLFTRGLHDGAQKETEIGLVPDTWEVVELGSLGQIGNGSTPKKSVARYWDGGNFPWLTSAKVYDRDISVAGQFVTPDALAECHLPVVDPGAVVVAITGQGKTLGHCAVLSMSATINQHLAYIQCDTERIDPRFLRGYLETQYQYLRQVGSGGGSTKGALTCAFLRSVSVPLPTLGEQAEIVEVLDALDQKIDLHQRKRAVLEELFRSLLHCLLNGEIRVEDLDISGLSVDIPEPDEAVA